jgi:hypothetical protein
MQDHPEWLEPINPLGIKEKVKKDFRGMNKQDQLSHIAAAQFAVIEAQANLQAAIEVFQDMNHQ